MLEFIIGTLSICLSVSLAAIFFYRGLCEQQRGYINRIDAENAELRSRYSMLKTAQRQSEKS